MAMRLNRLPAEIDSIDWYDVQLMLAHCELEQAELEAQQEARGSSSSGGGYRPKVQTQTEKTVYRLRGT